MNRGRRRGLLVIMAKKPVPGQVKTRLMPHLSPPDAANLYLCFLSDTLEEMAGLGGIDRSVAYAPAGARDYFANIVKGRFSLFPQRGRGLGSRLARIFREKFQEGYGAVVIMNSDSPDLPGGMVTQAFRRLVEGSIDAVFGPSPDGGYYLVGLKAVFPGLFARMPWSTDRVLAVSLTRAEKMGIRTALLPPWQDIDTFDDLIGFFRKCTKEKPGGPRIGRRTYDFLTGLELFKTP
jgi:uncharacterized protein